MTSIMPHLKIAFALTVLLSALPVIHAQSNAWNGIVPLKSTRADVEKLLGMPMPYSIARHAAGYRTKGGKADVIYSTGPCKSKPSHGWNVPELTVISVSFEPDIPIELSDLGLDEKNFEIHPDPGMLYTLIYTDETNGISITVDTVGNVATDFRYFPESRYDRLKCKTLKPRKPKAPTRTKGSKR